MPGARHAHFIAGDLVALTATDYVGLPAGSVGEVLRQSERLVLVRWDVMAHRRWANADALELLVPAG